MIDCLVQPVGLVKEKAKSYPTKEAAVVSMVFTSISKKKTYETFVKLQNTGRIKQYLNYYIKYQHLTIDDVTAILNRGTAQLHLFQLLLLTHFLHSASGGKRFDFEQFFVVHKDEIPPIPDPEVSDNDWLVSVLEDVRTTRSNISLEDFAETVTITAGKFKGEKYKHERAPYNRQIHRWMSPEDDCTELVNMWAVQVGKSTGMENAIIYYMSVVPSEILAVLATDDAAQKFVKDRIDMRAAKAGVKFVAENFGDTKKRRSGNKTLSKEFAGGNFDAVTAGSPSKLASATKRIILKDEPDRWPDTVGNEGDPDLVVDARAATWGDRKKIVTVCSPTLVHDSKIYPKYNDGTQHHFHIPCPICGNEYPLEFGQGTNDGLMYETKAGYIEDIFYICPHCKNEWREKEKYFTLQKGVWVPHQRAIKPKLISTQLSALYSTFRDWMDICTEHKSMIDEPNPKKDQAFQNMTLGLPYEPKGTRPEIEKLITLRDQTYKSKEVPEGVLYLTASCDVQRGSKNPETRKTNPPRLEIEVMGTCANFITKSVEYIVIHGATDHRGPGSAWEKLGEYIEQGKFQFYRRRDSFLFEPMMWFIDAGDGDNDQMDQVYGFCEEWGGAAANMYPIMGFAELKETKDKKGREDKKNRRDFSKYRRSVVSEELIVYQISTNYYKTKIYNDINKTIAKAGEDIVFPGRCYFPRDYPDKYFKMMRAEEMRPDGSFYCPKGRRNETFDLRVYNLCAANVYMNRVIDYLRNLAKAKHGKDVDVSIIGGMQAVDYLNTKTKQITVKK